MTVSVIIPTYQRPLLLKETLDSIWAQSLLPDEIIVGDDSKDDVTEKMIAKLIAGSPVPIRYFHHRNSLGEALNVDFQYRQSKGELLLHLHDDDPIYPCCIEVLKAAFQEFPDAIASFGLQRIIDENGDLIKNPEAVNESYFRTPERAGLVDGFMAGAVSMMPNNGFMVRRDAAVSIGYFDNGRAGLAPDFYFGFRLGKLGKPFVFVHEFTSKVRLTTNSQSRTSVADNAYRTVKILFEDCPPDKFTTELKQSLARRIPIAITIAAKKKDRVNAMRWLFSKYYRKKILTPRGLKRLLLILRP